MSNNIAVQNTNNQATKNLNAIDLMNEDIKAYENMAGNSENALRFLSIIKPFFLKKPELNTPQNYLAMKEGIFALASNNLYPIKGRNIAFFLDYKGVMTLQLGYQSFIELCARNGILINVQTVCLEDYFDLNLATGEIVHNPSDSRNVYNSESFRGVYATCNWKGQRITDYMNKEEILDHKKKFSKTKDKDQYGNDSAWVKSFGEMAKKTIIIRLCKKLPIIGMEGLQDLINYENEQNFTLTKKEDIKTQDKRKALQTVDLNVGTPEMDSYNPDPKDVETYFKNQVLVQSSDNSYQFDSFMEV